MSSTGGLYAPDGARETAAHVRALLVATAADDAEGQLALTAGLSEAEVQGLLLVMATSWIASIDGVHQQLMDLGLLAGPPEWTARDHTREVLREDGARSRTAPK